MSTEFKKISQLDAAGTLDGTELIPLVKNGVTVRSTIASIGVASSVTGFGAVGDGVTDDTLFIQRAIDSVYAAGGGDVLVPTGRYKVSASTLGETYDNGGVTVLSSACAIIQRAGVSLIGPQDRSASIFTTDRGLIIIAQIAPVGCALEGLEIYSDYTVGLTGSGAGVFTLGTAGGVDRSCRDNLYHNLYIHNVSGYAIGLQNGSPVRCRIEDVDVYYTGADGLDLKSRGEIGTTHPIVQPIGNSVTNCTIRHHGNRVTASAGIDIRGIWSLSNISVTDFGGDVTLEYEGIRFRTYPDPGNNPFEDWLDAARYSTLANFYIKATPGAAALVTNGIQIGSEDVYIANGTADGCSNNFAFIGNAFGASLDCSLVNAKSKDALIYGCIVNTGCFRNRIIGFTSEGSLTAGIRDQATDTQIIGWTSLTDTTPISTSVGAASTQLLLNGATAGSIKIGSSVTFQSLGDGAFSNSLAIGSFAATGVRLSQNAAITGATTAYSSLVASTVQSDVTATGLGYATSIGTLAAGFSTTIRHFQAGQGTFGAGSTVTNQYGFYAHQGLTGGTNNFGFYGAIDSAAGRWNLFMIGTAANYIAGALTVGNAVNYAVDSGSTDDYAVALSPALAAYTAGFRMTFKAATANTGAATLNVNGLGAKTIVKAVSTALANNDILASMLCHVVYDGTNFVLLNPRTL